MPRAKARHVAHASAQGGPCDDERIAKIVDYLEAKGLPRAGAAAFASSLNACAAHAYVLEPAMSSAKESLAWLKAARRCARQGDLDKLRAMIAEADDAAPEFAAGVSAPSLEAFERWCDHEIAARRKAKRAKPFSERQFFANLLAREWFTAFDGPPESCALPRARARPKASYEPGYGAKPDLPPFLQVCADLIKVAEIHYCGSHRKVKDWALRSYAYTAVAHERQRRERESRNLA